jgi:hypothetical protein
LVCWGLLRCTCFGIQPCRRKPWTRPAACETGREGLLGIGPPAQKAPEQTRGGERDVASEAVPLQEDWLQKTVEEMKDADVRKVLQSLSCVFCLVAGVRMCCGRSLSGSKP